MLRKIDIVDIVGCQARRIGKPLTAAKNNNENTIGNHQLPLVDRTADLADSASPKTFWF
jgi:hypothetical protein